MVAQQIRRLMSWHGAPLSGALYTFCRRYVMAWSNAEVEIAINGERWIVEAITGRAPVKNGVFLDVGANTGEWSALVLANAPDARLIAFEPVPPVREELSRNLAGGSAEILPYALSNESGTVEINYTPDNPHFSSIETVGEGLETGGRGGATSHRRRCLCGTRRRAHPLPEGRHRGPRSQGDRGIRTMIDTARIDVIQFEYNYMSIFSRTFLRDFFNSLTPTMRIGRLLRDRIDYFEYSPPLDNFIQANFIAVRADLVAGELPFLNSNGRLMNQSRTI